MMFGPKKISAFGLSVSDAGIKVMQLSRTRRGLFPTAFSEVDLPSTLIANHMIVDEVKLSEFLVRAVKMARNINTKYVVASVPEAKSFVRILKMPKMNESEMDGAVPWELEQDIPIPIDQVYMDWQIVKEDDENNHVLVTATPRDYVDALISSLKMAKLKPVALELESQALARSLVGSEPNGESSLIIDMSTTVTSFTIVSPSGVVEYTSNIPMGGGSLTESISKSLGVTPKEAEKIKVTQGLFADSKKGNASQAMLPILDNIVDEIKNVAKYHEDHSVLGHKLNKIILCGGAANLQGLVDYITARMNVGAGNPVDRIELGNPWVNITGKDGQAKLPIKPDQAVSFTTAIGLAMRGAQP